MKCFTSVGKDNGSCGVSFSWSICVFMLDFLVMIVFKGLLFSWGYFFYPSSNGFQKRNVNDLVHIWREKCWNVQNWMRHQTEWGCVVMSNLDSEQKPRCQTQEENPKSMRVQFVWLQCRKVSTLITVTQSHWPFCSSLSLSMLSCWDCSMVFVEPV